MKILVIGPSWVGDMMMSQGLYRTLKAEYSDITIDVMAPAWCRPLLSRMPEVNNAIAMPLGHGALALKERYRLGLSLRQANYQQAIILPNSFKSALVPFWARIPKRTGWRGEMRYGLINDMRFLDKQLFPLMIQRYIALAYDKRKITSAADLPKPLLNPQFNVLQQEITTLFERFALNSCRPVIGFCHGAEFGPAKRWPHYHYATLAKKLISEGIQIILFGSAKDQQAGDEICQMLMPEELVYCQNLSGKTTLDEAVIMLAGCHAVVSNDSGLMHIAAALDKPLVALYGPTSPDFTPPLSQHAVVIRLIKGYYKIRKGNTQAGYHQSLVDIQPERVIEELRVLLTNKAKSL